MSSNHKEPTSRAEGILFTARESNTAKPAAPPEKSTAAAKAKPATQAKAKSTATLEKPATQAKAKASARKASARKAAGDKTASKGGTARKGTTDKTAARKKRAAAASKGKDASPAKKRPIGRRAMLEETKELHKGSVSDEVMIRFSHVTKTFKLYRNDRARFLGLFGIRRKGSYLGTVDANKDLSFEIKRGEAVAFLGLNGAGKSTALKMITGVMYPTSGTVEVNGRVSALLELRAGFDSKLTGRENIHLRGQILGMTTEEIEELMPGVQEFAGLGMYFDQPMKSYSSGMKARLGFAFAVAVNPEILIVDEALAVGDKEFKRKCLQRIREIMMDENVTVLFVTHSSSTAQAFCSRGIVLDKGRKVYEGTIEDATEFYEEHY